MPRRREPRADGCPPPDRAYAQITAVTHNLHSAGNTPDSVDRHLERLARDTGMPELLVASEAFKVRGSIPGYDRVGPEWSRDKDECSTIVLVRRKHGISIRRDRTIKVDGPDWYWNGNRREPRLLVDFTLDADEQRWDGLAVHRTPGGPRAGIVANRASWAAEDAAIAAWFARRDRRFDRPTFAFGDWNDRATTVHPLGVRGLARRVDADLALKGIDGGIVAGARARSRKLDGRYGSDAHRPVVTILTVPRKD